MLLNRPTASVMISRPNSLSGYGYYLARDHIVHGEIPAPNLQTELDRVHLYGPVRIVQLSWFTSTVCSDWATGLPVCSTRTG